MAGRLTAGGALIVGPFPVTPQCFNAERGVATSKLRGLCRELKSIPGEPPAVKAFVVVATKGRPQEAANLLSHLRGQTYTAAAVVIVGASDSDVSLLREAESTQLHGTRVLVSDRPGLTVQRNVGVAWITSSIDANFVEDEDYFVAFFDDDFLPANDWLAHCANCFTTHRDIVGLTGRILADGVRGPGLTHRESLDYLAGRLPPQPHWASGSQPRDTGSVYGCNMAFRNTAIRGCRFDETLPLYGWQEDQDFTSQAIHFGRVIYWPNCKGVHMGIKVGRTSGVRFGYSQIANPIYLVGKRTMRAWKAIRFIVRHLLANHVRSLRPPPYTDYRGRLRGNWLALLDLATGKCHPTRILEIG